MKAAAVGGESGLTVRAKLHEVFKVMVRNWPFFWVRKEAIRSLWDKEGQEEEKGSY